MFINFLLRWMIYLWLSFICIYLFNYIFVFSSWEWNQHAKIKLHTFLSPWDKPPPDAIQTNFFCKCVAAYINAFRIVFFFPAHILLTSTANGILSLTDCGNVYLQMWADQLLKPTCAPWTEHNWFFIAYFTFGRWRSLSRCSLSFLLCTSCLCQLYQFTIASL